MIKIRKTEIIQDGRKIKICIERAGRHVFVYPIDKFNNKQEMIEEIEASIAKEERIKKEREEKIKKLRC